MLGSGWEPHWQGASTENLARHWLTCKCTSTTGRFPVVSIKGLSKFTLVPFVKIYDQPNDQLTQMPAFNKKLHSKLAFQARDTTGISFNNAS